MINTSGQEVAKRSYLPFGETWGVSATELPTDYTYTGQREAAEIGLKYYVARWYDSEIGHFIQADTIVPKPGNPLAWNRYAYVNYRPLIHTDPSGHWLGGDYYDPACAETITEQEDYIRMVYSIGLYSDSGVSSTPSPRKSPTPTPAPPLEPPSTPTPSPIGYDTSPSHTPTPLPEEILIGPIFPDLGLAFSVSVEQAMGTGYYGTIAETGLVWINGQHTFVSVGESNPSSVGMSEGINFGLSWGVNSTTDFEGWGQEAGISIPFGIPIGPIVIPVSVAAGLSFDLDGGILGIGKITGITISPQLGPEAGFNWSSAFTTIVGD
ncbi:RHS repeat-associated core domain-containing protein [Chloroflexota bacterium]|nr:RHS repeat-associated core domain-containing protein [Chloroflexota bacterium]